MSAKIKIAPQDTTISLKNPHRYDIQSNCGWPLMRGGCKIMHNDDGILVHGEVLRYWNILQVKQQYKTLFSFLITGRVLVGSASMN